MNWMLFLTKENALVHIFLASSEQFFLNWLQRKISNGISVVTIGDLNKIDANIYFNFLKPPPDLSFENVFPLTGIFSCHKIKLFTQS